MRALLCMLPVAVALLHPAVASAQCKCADRPPDKAMRAAQVVFEGKVVKVATPEREPTTVRYTFAVSRSFKGTREGEQVTVITDKAGGCAMTLAPGSAHLVAAEDEGFGYPMLKPCHPFYRAGTAKDLDKLRKQLASIVPAKPAADAHGHGEDDGHGHGEDEAAEPEPAPVAKPAKATKKKGR